ncbi:MAG: NAD(P)H-dependent oxidoreductase subunit E [Actinobacteria bacterium]|nr:NAD(P)H-dependent oxidoreductase subunit E [Actinomycetota bacterium]
MRPCTAIRTWTDDPSLKRGSILSHDRCACSEEQERDDIDLALLSPVLERHLGQPGALIPVLQEAQEVYGYLPETVLRAIGRGLGVAIAEVYGVTTFYSQFHLEPRGRTVIRICHGTACHVRGADAVTTVLTDELGVGVGQTAPDLSYTIESVACVGCCGLAPVVVVDEQMHGGLDSNKARKLARRLQREHTR